MTQEEKARKYDVALANARQEYNTIENVERKQWLEELFPELIESEDDRIRKTLIRYHKSTIDVDGIKGDDIIAWLEKQGEHKVWTDNDYDSVKSIEYLLHELDNHNFDDWFNSLKKDNV